MNRKSGFGLIEVMIAAVVLAFLIVGLNILQKGNREAILRVRARDAANFVAQHVLDSISSMGMKAMEKNIKANCPNPPSKPLERIYCDPSYVYYFEGKPQLDKKTSGIKMRVEYTVEVFALGGDTERKSNEYTFFRGDNNNVYSQGLEALVSWKHNASKQSISMAKVVK
ncbi:MAG: type II secretion system GspH family protein [Fibromonadales bacterium]|nr:type II secretion system GspH family protein [Fibromonadales bacterium]